VGKIKKWLPLLLLLAALIAVFASWQGGYFTIDSLRAHRQAWVEGVSTHWLLASVLFTLIYFLTTVFFLPTGIFLALVGGFLFSQPWSTLYVTVGSTLGSVVVFLAVKTAFGVSLQKKAAPFMEKMEKEFRKNEVSYLLFLRLVPFFPFFVINVAPAMFGVSLWTFFWTTFIGTIPSSVIFAQMGSGLGAVLDTNEKVSVGDFLTPQVMIGLSALGILSLIPVFLKKFRS
jgi:uncharacterized membrane protein YdjX (TVP38/TMEM64 family)